MLGQNDLALSHVARASRTNMRCSSSQACIDFSGKLVQKGAHRSRGLALGYLGLELGDTSLHMHASP